MCVFNLLKNERNLRFDYITIFQVDLPFIFGLKLISWWGFMFDRMLKALAVTVWLEMCVMMKSVKLHQLSLQFLGESVQ